MQTQIARNHYEAMICVCQRTIKYIDPDSVIDSLFLVMPDQASCNDSFTGIPGEIAGSEWAYFNDFSVLPPWIDENFLCLA